MTAIIVLGMIGAFFAGAFIRKPFDIAKKKEEMPICEQKEKDDKNGIKVRQWSALLDYTGERRESN